MPLNLVCIIETIIVTFQLMNVKMTHAMLSTSRHHLSTMEECPLHRVALLIGVVVPMVKV